MRISPPQAIDLFNLVSTFFVVLSILQVRTIIKCHLECSKLHMIAVISLPSSAWSSRITGTGGATTVTKRLTKLRYTVMTKKFHRE